VSVPPPAALLRALRTSRQALASWYVLAFQPPGLAERAFRAEGRPFSLSYDRLVFALGSELARPPIPGLAEYGFDIDTYDAAEKLAAHLTALPRRPDEPGRFTALVVGGGLTGVEAATELASRLPEIAAGGPARVIVADRAARIGSNMGDGACAVIAEALAALGVETRTGVTIAAIDRQGVVLSSGERIAAATVVWCGGMRAHPLAAAVPGEHDRFGRIAVDRFLKVPGALEANYLQEQAAATRLQIPLLIGTDAIHGHGMDVAAATIFPSPISFASAFDPTFALSAASAFT